MLEWTREELPNTQLVLCEPFVLRCGVVQNDWILEMDQRRRITRTLANEFDALLIPFQDMFNKDVKEAPVDYWVLDGVHLTVAGHQRMTDLWLNTVF